MRMSRHRTQKATLVSVPLVIIWFVANSILSLYDLKISCIKEKYIQWSFLLSLTNMVEFSLLIKTERFNQNVFFSRKI